MLLSSDSKSKPSFAADLFFGAWVPFRALRLILTHRKLFSLSFLPILMGILLLGFLVFLFVSGFYAWSTQAFEVWASGWSTALATTGAVLVGIVIVLMSVYSLGLVAGLIASPFNDFLAEQTEKAANVPLTKPEGWGQVIRVIWVDLKKTALSLFFLVIITLGMLIPGANILFFLGLGLLNTFTFVTYPQSRRQLGVRDSLGWVFQNLGLSLGFGLVISGLFLVPVLNILVLPIAVVGGTLLYFRK